jgi:glycosyltransferase involved in cell wall biosynthesis
MHNTFISIVIPTLGRKTLYPLVESLQKQKISSEYEIILIPQIKLIELKLKTNKVKIKYQPPGKGFSYYRNIGIKISRGDIIVFIDDDELPMDLFWLDKITQPIIKHSEQVVTSGYRVKLGHGYFTDSVSLLGFPGGGAIGYKTMWPVSKDNYTNHICTGNLAITKQLLKRVNNFDLSLVHGNEDVVLADKITAEGIKIKYQENATVYHVHRSGYINFIKWNILRGKSAFELKQLKKRVGYNVANRIRSSQLVLIKTLKTKYFPMILLMMINQYFWQAVGYSLQSKKLGGK